jgi:[1-hydroxy-2-(trimethylamino)ethyl]phosphonate dioxygenase
MLRLPDAVEEVRQIFETTGSEPYESGVTHVEHALQCATFAVRERASNVLVSAALLHDIGHLLPHSASTASEANHESIGAQWIAQRFNSEIAEISKLHVAAKRYLCFFEAGYASRLSADSALSLLEQGGPFIASEADEFLQNPHSNGALALRRWDDLGKIFGMKTEPLSVFLSRLMSEVRR